MSDFTYTTTTGRKYITVLLPGEPDSSARRMKVANVVFQWLPSWQVRHSGREPRYKMKDQALIMSCRVIFNSDDPDITWDEGDFLDLLGRDDLRVTLWNESLEYTGQILSWRAVPRVLSTGARWVDYYITMKLSLFETTGEDTCST